MTFGQKLQTLRQRAGMSQDVLAERMGVSRQAVSRWERDETMRTRTRSWSWRICSASPRIICCARTAGGPPAAQPRNNGGRSGTGRRESWDFIDRMGYLAKTKGYLLGWVLVVWGALDLLVLLLMGMGVLGMLTMW